MCGRNAKAGKAARLFFLSAALTLFCLAGANASAAQDGTARSESYLFANGKAELDGTLYALFSKLELSGDGPGLVYSFFSEITLRGDAEVKALSSKILYPQSAAVTVAGWPVEAFSRLGAEDGFVTFSNRFPPYVIHTVLILAAAAVCTGALLTAGGFVSQGGVILTAEPGKVIRNGVVSYILMLALTLISSLTVILTPIAALILLFAVTLMVLGQTSLSLLIGLAASRNLGKTFSRGAYFAVGLLALCVISFIPVINVTAGLIFIPILTLGITVTSVSDGVFRHRYFYAPFKSRRDQYRRKEFDHETKTRLLGGGK